MKETVKICYVDDNQDLVLSEYLMGFSEQESNVLYDYTEHRFTRKDNYQTLLDNESLNEADIVVIDSWLFNSSEFQGEKLTGEQFKIVLRKIFPYKKTIVISQNQISDDSLTISKYRTSNVEQKSNEYYDEILKPLLEKYTKECIEERYLINTIAHSGTIDSVLVSKIEKNVEGLNDDTLIKKADLDKLIDLFQEVKGNYDD
ncbi:Mu-like prophage major head subunit gpT family protein [Vagococcus sp.]|uniref:Mu-like prophage major head subunit gpT family protein n=1 Tax=Vagococcus sp. TaxID=1933889 RepID=UPI002FC8C07A